MIPVMLGNRTSEQWVAQYSTSHQHPVNRVCHTLGIPTILISLALFLAGIFFHKLWPYAAALFVLGWLLQFIGHAFEGKEPEFFHDWRFLLVGARWWWAKINGKA
ncbi:MAG: Mpo1-like protein [Terriglobales bacterium]